jgi:hypothetical protein
MYYGKVEFFKYTKHDNYEHGCDGNSWGVYSQTFHLEFSDSDDLIQQLAQWTSENFDVPFDEINKGLTNYVGNKFEFCQNENSDGDHITITANNPDGYLSDYEFFVDDVYVKVDYNFQTGGINQ